MDDNQVSKYDRTYGSSKMVAMMTKPTTITTTETVTGRTETFIVQTARHEDGDRIYVQCVDENQAVVRLALPVKVSNAIASQRDALTSKRRSITGRRLAKERQERGELPGFMRKKKG
ncbi:MAG: hypothetical protein ABSG08_22810 [Terriglobales bacterium]